jgi:hypothetical protein
MAKTELGFLDYVKAAFSWRYRVPGLGHLPLNILALVGFGILGLGHPAFWLLGLAFEAGYLTLMSGDARFQRLVQGRMLMEERRVWQAKQSNLFDSLDPQSQLRYRSLADTCQQILKSTKALAPGSAMEDLRTGSLSQMAWMFLKLLYTKIRTRSIKVKAEELEAEIKRLSDQLSREAEGSAIHRSLQGTLEIQRRRMENLTKARESLKVIEAELNRIEHQVRLLNEEASMASDPEALTVRLDGVMQSLDGTNKWMSEHGELFGGLEEATMPQNLLDMPPRQTEG